MDSNAKPLDVTIICPTLFENDAVGRATRETYLELSKNSRFRVSILAKRNEFKDIPFYYIKGANDILLNEIFNNADVLIYIFAIHNDVFDTLIIGNGRAKKIVRFHNVTPSANGSFEDHEILNKSLEQIGNFYFADEIWADSQENKNALTTNGINDKSVSVQAIGVKLPSCARLFLNSIEKINILYVGRFVESKGIEELLDSIKLIKELTKVPFRVDIVGSIRHSKPEYIQRLNQRCGELNLADSVNIEGGVSTARLGSLYKRAHIVTTASRHEGFCVPVIEGLAAGCVPVTYANSNLRFIAGGLGYLAQQDTPEALADVLVEAIEAIRASGDRKLKLTGGTVSIKDFDTAAAAYVKNFDPAVCGQRLSDRIDRLFAD